LVLLKKFYWVIISRRRRCSTYVGNLRQRNCFEDLGLQYMGRHWNWSLKIGWDGMLWIDLVKDKGLGRAVMSTIIKTWVPQNVGHFLIRQETARFKRKTLLRAVSWLVT
jgi:hypothetical protein